MAGLVQFGMTCEIGGYSNFDAFQDMEFGGAANSWGDGCGKMEWRRSFKPPGTGPQAFNQSPASIDPSLDVHSWVSYKGVSSNTNTNLQAYINGDYDADLLNFINTTPAGHKVIFTVHHEPENDSGISATLWRNAQKYIHHFITTNKGSKDISVSPVIMGYTMYDVSGRDINDWMPVYQQGDTIPAGFAVGDPAWDIYGLDLYDEGGNWYNLTWAAQTLPSGNPDGITGMLDKLVDSVNYWRQQEGLPQTYARGDLVWAIGELATANRESTAQRDWLIDIIEGMRDDESTGGAIAWFHVATNPNWTDLLLDASETQAWLKANGNTWDGGGTAGIVKSLAFTYDVLAGTTLVNSDIALQWDIDGTVHNTVQVVFDLEGIIGNEVAFEWHVDQELPIIPEGQRRIVPSAGRLQSGSPNAPRPASPDAEPP